MLAEMIEDTYYEVEMSPIAHEPANVFYHNLGECYKWKESGKPLRILRDGKVVAELASWNTINIKENKEIVRLMNPKNNPYGDFTFLPTWALYTRHYYKLYDLSCGSKTKNGTIQLDKYQPPKNKPTPQQIIGELGENAIEAYYPQAVKTLDWYDPTKDGTMGSVMLYEAKTVQLNQKTQSFWMSVNQGNKLDGVDLLFFIEIPQPHEEHIAKVYLAIDHKNSWEYAYKNDGTKVRSYPLTKCLYQFSMDKETTLKIMQLSDDISTFRNKR